MTLADSSAVALLAVYRFKAIAFIALEAWYISKHHASNVSQQVLFSPKSFLHARERYHVVRMPATRLI